MQFLHRGDCLGSGQPAKWPRFVVVLGIGSVLPLLTVARRGANKGARASARGPRVASPETAPDPDRSLVPGQAIAVWGSVRLGSGRGSFELGERASSDKEGVGPRIRAVRARAS